MGEDLIIGVHSTKLGSPEKSQGAIFDPRREAIFMQDPFLHHNLSLVERIYTIYTTASIASSNSKQFGTKID